MSRPDSSSPSVSLRSALAGRFPELRAVALGIIRASIRESPTLGAAAERLGLARRALERLRVDFPEIDSD